MGGGNLEDLITDMGEEHWLEEACVAAYICQVLAAVAYCHSRGAYHRDLHPSSVALTSKLPDAVARIRDFGIAPLVDPSNRGLLDNPSPYQAPELSQKSGQVSGSGLDVWSVGAIAHALLVGQPPMENTSSWDITPSRFLGRCPNEEAWLNRSALSRDFARCALQPSTWQRPSAAALLDHPWLRTVMVPRLPPGQAHMAMVEAVNHSIFCYVVSLLLIPALVTQKDLDNLWQDFLNADEESESVLPRRAAVTLLGGRHFVAGAATPDPQELEAALHLVDVRNVGVLDFAGIACGGLLASVLASAHSSGPLLVDAGSFTSPARSRAGSHTSSPNGRPCSPSGRSASPRSILGRSSSRPYGHASSPHRDHPSPHGHSSDIHRRSSSPSAHSSSPEGRKNAGSSSPECRQSTSRQSSPVQLDQAQHAAAGRPRSCSSQSSSPMTGCQANFGMSSSPRQRPMQQAMAVRDPGEARRQLLRRFVESFCKHGQQTVHCADLRLWMRSATGKSMESLAKVNYAEMLSVLPEDCLIDEVALQKLSSMDKRGTPLCCDGLAPLLAKDSSRFEEGLSLFMRGVLQACSPCASGHV